MEDLEIIELYWRHSERAIAESDAKYGAYCKKIAENILGNPEDAAECVNDTWFRAWNAIPPERPESLKMFLAKIVRNLAVDKARKNAAQKRGGGELNLVLDELYDIASDYSVEKIAEQHEIMALINKFLGRLSERKRLVFVLRYWHCCSAAEISQAVGISEANVYNVLKRVRKKLLEYLEKG